MILEAPNRIADYNNLGIKVFLAGTIENGKSIDWQSEISSYCNEIGLTAFNPRRSKWNEKANEEELSEQISWELEHMEKADYIIMYILGDSKSPISLLELGLHAREGKLIVFCPKSFYRYKNVEITCNRYNIPLYSFETYAANIDVIKNVFKDISSKK